MMLRAMASQLAGGVGHVTFRPRGNSMAPRIKSGEQVTVYKVRRPEKLVPGMVVLAKVSGRVYLHKITAVDPARERVQIGNERGRINGWTPYRNVYGIYRTDEEWEALLDFRG